MVSVNEEKPGKTVIKMSLIPINVLGMITICFVVAKLMNVIDWSWWLVLAPTLWPVYAFAAIVLFLAGIAFIAAIGVGVFFLGVFLWEKWDTRTNKNYLRGVKRSKP